MLGSGRREVCVTKIMPGPEMDGGLDGVRTTDRGGARRVTEESHGQARCRWRGKLVEEDRDRESMAQPV